MTTAYTSLLGLALPVTGELSGTWGDTVNNSITSLLDSAVSGTTTLSTDADATLTTTSGAANEARQAIILWNPASGTVTRNITAPAQSKIYTVINASGGTQSIVIRGAGPTTGVTVIKGESAVVAWNGSDFIKISNTGGAGSFTNVTISGTTTLSGLTASTALALNSSKEVVSVTNTGTGNNVLSASPTLTGTVAGASLQLSSLTSGRVPYASTAGLLTDSANLTFNGTDLTVSGAVNAGTINATTLDLTNLEVTNIKAKDGTAGMQIADSTGVVSFTANPTFSGGTANGVTYLNGSKVLTSGSALTFNGTNLGIGIASASQVIHAKAADPFLQLERTSGASAYVGVDVTGMYVGSNSAIPIYFNVTGTERMRLTSTGLGIGTSSPTEKLHVAGALRVTGVQTTAGTGVYLDQTSGTGGVSVYGPDNSTQGTFRIYTATANGGIGSTKLTLDSSGNLGLGVAPSAWPSHTAFEIKGTGNAIASSTSGEVLQTAGAYFNAGWKYGNSTYAPVRLDMFNGVFKWFTAPSGTAGNTISFTQAMTLDASGNLGVGTTSPLIASGYTNLVVSNATNGGILYVDRTSGARGYFYANATTSVVLGTVGAYPLVFNTADTERARIDTSGNLLVGLTSAIVADGKFQAKNSSISQATGYFQNATTTGNAIFASFGTEASYTERGSISYNRAGGLTTYNTTSDYRAKDIIGPVTDSGALIDATPVYMGKMKGATQERPMFIAHETPAYAHTGEKDAVDADGNPVYQQMDASALVPVMWAEIQSLRQRLAAAGI